MKALRNRRIRRRFGGRRRGMMTMEAIMAIGVMLPLFAAGLWLTIAAARAFHQMSSVFAGWPFL